MATFVSMVVVERAGKRYECREARKFDIRWECGCCQARNRDSHVLPKLGMFCRNCRARVVEVRTRKPKKEGVKLCVL